LIGRRFDDDVVKKDMDMVPYEIIKADNGDAWVKVDDKKISTSSDFSRGFEEA
jgi:molecular chaperone DnaK